LLKRRRDNGYAGRNFPPPGKRGRSPFYEDAPSSLLFPRGGRRGERFLTAPSREREREKAIILEREEGT